MRFVFIACLAYLAGSIPSAWMAAKLRGVDIFNAGSGNAGATNAFRVLGFLPGTLVLLADLAKAFVAVLAIPPFARLLFLLPTASVAGDELMLARCIAGFACVLGHVFPVWLRFHGGKGVATGAAAAIAIAPWPHSAVLRFF